MAETIRFEISGWVEEDELEDYIAANHEEYAAALDLSANPNDDRSQVDKINVVRVELEEDSVTIFYTVEYSAYHGCRDINYADSDERELVGTRQGRVLVFEKHEYPEPLAPDEEL